VSAHSGVIYDYGTRTQQLLQGHCNPITCSVVSADKRWVATADAGADSMIVVWDTLSTTPIKTLFNPHPCGVQAMAMTPDAMFLATLSAPDPDDPSAAQQIALWEWTVDRSDPLYVADVVGDDLQTAIAFNPSDCREVVTNSASRVQFWSWESKAWTFYAPQLSKVDFPNAGAFTQSCFIPDTHKCITATKAGALILWDRSMVGVSEGHGNPTDRRATKMLPLSQLGIGVVATAGDYVVVGSDDGAVRFYDFQFRLHAWFEDLDAGPVTSVSFANMLPPPPLDQGGFTVADFVVGTSKALVVGVDPLCFNELTADRRRGTLLTQGIDSEICGTAVHPARPHLAIVAASGTVQLWDFEEKRLMMVRVLELREPTEKRPTGSKPVLTTYDPLGRFLAVGFSDGVLQLLDTATLQDLPLARFQESQNTPLTHVCFSRDGSMMVTCDADRFVALFMYTTDRALFTAEAAGKLLGGDDDEVQAALERCAGAWVCVGRSRLHTAAIVGVEFGLAGDGRPLLMSVAEDRTMVEYDLENSSITNGLIARGVPTVVELDATPTACMWHPRGPEDREDLFVTVNSDYKFRLWNWNASATNKTCRRTVLGPTYGGALRKLVRMPRNTNVDPVVGADGSVAAPAEYVAYATANKVAGLIRLPFDGNPSRGMGLVAHPAAIGDVAFSSDGRWLLTSGTDDMAINLWRVDTGAIEAAVAEAGTGQGAFNNMVDGGPDGEFYQDMVDYFYYSQLRAQGEMSTDTRSTDGRVPLEEIPNLMRALGYYPTERDIENMTSEVKYANYLVDGTVADSINFDDFVRLYINHRPVFGISKEQIQDAFATISSHCVQAFGRRARGSGEDAPKLLWNDLSELMKGGAEALTEDEFRSCLQSLLGEQEGADVSGHIGPLSFADNVLGFADYEGGDDGGQGEEMMAESLEGKGSYEEKYE
jgi:WD40 repeat protein